MLLLCLIKKKIALIINFVSKDYTTDTILEDQKGLLINFD